jgi:RNA polymerase sigma-70 factor (ECF subfamily)
MEQVISQKLPFLYRSALRLLGNDADAEDVVQDALLSAHQHLDQFRGQSQLSTWLVTIVMNCARMKIRKRANKIHLSLDESTEECQDYSVAKALTDRRPNPEDDCLRSDFRARVLQFVARLSPKLRDTFQMRDLEGLTIKETALILGVPRGTVKAQLSRARKQLRHFMSQAARGSGLTVRKSTVRGNGRCQRP